MMDLYQYFKHMERIILGTGYVDLEYPPEPHELPCFYGGRSVQCPFCNVYFKAPKRKNRIECPCCFKMITLELEDHDKKRVSIND